MARQLGRAHVKKRPVVGRRNDARVAMQRLRRTRILRLPVRHHASWRRRKCDRVVEPRAGKHHREIRALLMHVDARLLLEHPRHRVGKAIDQPLLAEVVVEHHQAARLQMVADRAKRFLREHVALQPYAGEARLHGQRIDQREHHEVVPLRRRREEMPRIVDDGRHARIVVRPIRVPLLSKAQDHRIDFNGVDVLRAVPQRRGDVRARSGAENQDVVERVAECGVRPLIEVFLPIDR